MDTNAFAFIPTLLGGFRQVNRAPDTLFPTESAECKNFAEIGSAYELHAGRELARVALRVFPHGPSG